MINSQKRESKKIPLDYTAFGKIEINLNDISSTKYKNLERI